MKFIPYMIVSVIFVINVNIWILLFRKNSYVKEGFIAVNVQQHFNFKETEKMENDRIPVVKILRANNLVGHNSNRNEVKTDKMSIDVTQFNNDENKFGQNMKNSLDKLIITSYNTAELKNAIAQRRKDMLTKLGLFRDTQCQKKPAKCVIVSGITSSAAHLMDFLALHPFINVPETSSQAFRKTRETRTRSKQRFMHSLTSFDFEEGDYDELIENNVAERNMDNSNNTSLNGTAAGQTKPWNIETSPCVYSGQVGVDKVISESIDEVPQSLKTLSSHEREDMKIILILRNPVDQLFHDYVRLNGGSKDFNLSDLKSCALKSEIINEPCIFMKNSLYDLMIESWLKYFDLKQLMILDEEDVHKNLTSIIHQVESFLKIDHFSMDKNLVFNEKVGSYCLRDDDSGMICHTLQHKRNKLDLNRTFKETISRIFQPHNEAFFKMIGKKFEW